MQHTQRFFSKQTAVNKKPPIFSIHFSPNPTQSYNHMPSKKALMPIEFFPHFATSLLLDGGSNVGVVGQQFAHGSKCVLKCVINFFFYFLYAWC